MSDLSEAVVCRACIKKTGSNHETGERTIILGLPQTEAGNVARLSIFDGIEFEVTFKPIAAGGEQL